MTTPDPDPTPPADPREDAKTADRDWFREFEDAPGPKLSPEEIEHYTGGSTPGLSLD